MVWKNYYDNKKNYSEYHRVEYPENSNKWYIFDPYSFGIGMWRVLSPTGKPAKVLEKSKQIELNEFVFDKSELPSMYERFMSASKEEREKYKEISIGWLQLKLKSIQQNVVVPKTINPSSRQFTEGRMYFFVYDAKLKEILPKWDALPLVIILEKYSDGFLGLNLHYLDQNTRLKVLNEMLKDYSSYSKNSDILYVRLRYERLKKSIEFKQNSVCIKKYLTKQIKSKILPIESHEWIYAAALPVQQFKIKR